MFKKKYYKYFGCTFLFISVKLREILLLFRFRDVFFFVLVLILINAKFVYIAHKSIYIFTLFYSINKHIMCLNILNISLVILIGQKLIWPNNVIVVGLFRLVKGISNFVSNKKQNQPLKFFSTHFIIDMLVQQKITCS